MVKLPSSHPLGKGHVPPGVILPQICMDDVLNNLASLGTSCIQGCSLKAASLKQLHTHLLLSTDVADDGAGGWAGGWSQDSDHSLGEDLTHCSQDKNRIGEENTTSDDAAQSLTMLDHYPTPSPSAHTQSRLLSAPSKPKSLLLSLVC